MDKASGSNNAKRQKDKENVNKEKQEKRISAHDWDQTDIDITITLDVGQVLDPKSVQLNSDDKVCRILLPDDRYWECQFYQPIIGEEIILQSKENLLLVKLKKKIPNQCWPQLDIENDGLEKHKEETIYHLQHLKHAWYEKQTNCVAVTVYVKNIKTDALHVAFFPKFFSVKFQTSDAKFLQLHPNTSKFTNFFWIINLKDEILPKECSYRVTGIVLEIILKKVEIKRWGALEAPVSKSQASAFPSDKWVPISDSKIISKSTDVEMTDHVPMKGEGDACGDGSDSNLTHVAEQIKIEAAKKPTCMVSPLNKSKQTEQSVPYGMTGLDNLGNTCFMNSVIQCLSNTRELREYFLGVHFQRDINVDNPLGTHGKLAIAFAVLLRVLWSKKYKSYAPSKLKSIISVNATQFTGFAQHDAQEFMAFLLDGLHEDLNRVKQKPYIQSTDCEKRADEVVAEEAWHIYKQRNDSIVVDLFQGQYKSKLKCPICSKVSITFDPFLYLSVPLPKNKRTYPVVFFSKDIRSRPTKYYLRLSQDALVDELKDEIAKITAVASTTLRVFEVNKSKIQKIFENGTSLSTVANTTLLLVFEILSEKLAGEPVIEFMVTQRIVMPRPVTKCSFCKRECPSGTEKLKRCTKCYRAGYCDQQCQKNHWSTHKANCKPLPELVGCPFMISLPQSQATYMNISRMMEAVSRFSVDVFQPPINLHGNLSRDSSMGLSSVSDFSSNQSLNTMSEQQSVATSLSTAGSCASVNQLLSCGNSLHDVEMDEKNNTLDNKACEEAMQQFKKEDFEKHELETDESESKLDLFEEKVRKEIVNKSPSLQSRKKDSKDSNEVQPSASNILNKDAQLGSKSYDWSMNTMAPLVRVVFGQSHDKIAEKPAPVFSIRTVNQMGQDIPDRTEKLEDKGDEPLDISSKYLAMDWQNNEKLKNYVLVQSKELEFDLDKNETSSSNMERNNITLEQCLQLFTEPETLTPNEAWYCPRCKAHREATKQMSIWRLPTNLIIQLKRFSFKNLVWRDKIDKMVEFPLRELDISPYYCGPTRPAETLKYDLYAVVNHSGGILGGHYTAYSRLVEENNTRRSEVGWRLFDDSRVVSIHERDIVSRTAYLLFYRRRGTPFVLSQEDSDFVETTTRDNVDSRFTSSSNNSIHRPQHESKSSCQTMVIDSNILNQQMDSTNMDNYDSSSISDMDAVD